MLYSETLASMIGAIRLHKPNATPELCREWINKRIRRAIDKRPYWAGTLKRGVLSIPAPYTKGAVSLSTGSTTLTGAGTDWPVDDLISTTLSTAVKAGAAMATPASMAGITADTMLVIEAEGQNPEIVAVEDTSTRSFIAHFAYDHAASVTIKASSLAGLQLKLGMSAPIFTVRGVLSATSADLDMPWGGAALSNASYQLIKMYVTLAPDLKDILCMVDPTVPTIFTLHVPQGMVDATDAQRSTVSDPEWLVDLTPNENGNMLYEIYPACVSARQIRYLYARQWPSLRSPGDRPPYFINPTAFVSGAIADALSTKIAPEDRYYDPKVALAKWEPEAIEALNDAMMADNAKAQQQFEWEYSQLLGQPGGAAWRQSHEEIDL